MENHLEDTIIEDKDTIIKELYLKIELLETIPKHGDEIMLYELIKKMTSYEIQKATPQQLEECLQFAIMAQNKQINENNNIFLDTNGYPRKRFNECGNDMERVIKSIDKSRIRGFSQSAGYPDLQTDTYYLECKVAGLDNIKTTLRSFYVSTFTKINRSIPHILVCFIHEDGKLNKERIPKVIDLYDIKLKLKCEWFSTNQEMYS